MNKIKVRKLVPEAVLPKQAINGDAGYDLVAVDDGVMSSDGRYIEYGTGIAITYARWENEWGCYGPRPNV